MSTPFMGELRMFSFGFAPRGWAFANGQKMSIQQNAALFSLFGTMYGGDGTQTFLLPNLQGRTPTHRSALLPQGSVGGSPAVTLSLSQIPVHTHPMFVNDASATSKDPAGNAPAGATTMIYGGPGALPFDPVATTSAGGDQSHHNMPPYLTINWCVALSGIFPSRN
jgi:microcystin-dependent protein